jgi:glycosyltransferase involved in cell wall biosynthesis
MTDVSVVVPVYRNADTLHELHARVATTLERAGLSFELIMVDDGCPAGSGAVMESIARGDSRVRAVTMTANSGQHRALLAGLAAATGDWAVLMDADLQDPPEAIPVLMAARERGYAVVFAGRRGKYQSSRRMLSARVYRELLHFMSGMPRDAGLFVAMQRNVVERLLSLDGPEPSIVSMIWCTDAQMTSIPIVRMPRAIGVSSYSGWKRLRAAWRAFAWIIWWQTRLRGRSRRPARARSTARVTAADASGGIDNG